MSIALTTALEAVKFQAQPVLFEAVTRQIKKIRAENDLTTNAPGVVELTDLMRRYTGLSLTITFPDTNVVNASVAVPDIHRNHPVLNAAHRAHAGNRDIMSLLRKRGLDKLEAAVDIQQGRVEGFYQELDCQIMLSEGLINDISFEHEEVAAIFLHEVGHLMSYFEYVHRGVTSNYALLSVAEEMVKSDPKVRVELIDATSKYFKLDRDGLEGLEESNSKEAVYSVLITRHIAQVRSELGTNVYDQRGCEFMADQYVARVGGGVPLVTAMAKMYRRHPSRYPTAKFVAFEAMKLTLAALSNLAIGPFVLILMLVAYDPTNKIYDDPEARMKRIRNELIQGSKDRNLSDSRKAALKADLEIVDEALSAYNDRRSFYEFLYTTFLPSVRDQHKRMKQQQELEALAHNELFAKAMNFTLIKG